MDYPCAVPNTAGGSRYCTPDSGVNRFDKTAKPGDFPSGRRRTRQAGLAAIVVGSLMFEFAWGLFDAAGFSPRGTGEAWTAALTWMHVGGDLFVWLACLTIPIVLLYFTRRRDFPHPWLAALLALFLL